MIQKVNQRERKKEKIENLLEEAESTLYELDKKQQKINELQEFQLELYPTKKNYSNVSNKIFYQKLPSNLVSIVENYTSESVSGRVETSTDQQLQQLQDKQLTAKSKFRPASEQSKRLLSNISNQKGHQDGQTQSQLLAKNEVNLKVEIEQLGNFNKFKTDQRKYESTTKINILNNSISKLPTHHNDLYLNKSYTKSSENKPKRLQSEFLQKTPDQYLKQPSNTESKAITITTQIHQYQPNIQENKSQILRLNTSNKSPSYQKQTTNLSFKSQEFHSVKGKNLLPPIFSGPQNKRQMTQL
ncbi:UNKNOWN [Stylonychia lemnae]|uniref:Uncharacterized protein n=1 Tax=Stylonychia lemnae TaxID=5949 RepID=A0A077ZXJ6_STYLE|nr:UNKNOWN [Stylonychia lemnae]|eukprot:CDW74631.1 UNKNOWN [Stylonychia lemnae]